MASKPYQLVLTLFAIAALSNVAFAQDDRRRGNWDPGEYLQRVDENKNGQMDPGELKGRLADYVRNLGFTTEQPVPISEIVKRAKNGGANSRERSENNASEKTFVRKVPGFGSQTESTGGGGVSNFSPDGSISNPAVLLRRYGESIMSEVDRSMARYDANRDGVLDKAEMEKGRWGRPSPTDSDTNKDGRLTKNELAERYKLRQAGGDQGNSSRDRNDRNSRDRNSRDRNDRGNDRNGRDSRETSRDRGSSSDNSSDARARARAAAEKAAREREAERENREREKEREDLQGSSARERAREAAARQLAARREQRASESKDESSSPSRTRSSSRTSSDRYRTVANGMIRKYDKNSDGSLDAKELESYRRLPENADGNSDGKVTADELFDAYVAKAGGSSSSSSRDSGSSSSRDSGSSRSSSRQSSRSSGEDKDGDGRIKMSEFASDWTQEKIDEFNRLDRNRDGFLSKDEFSKR